MGRTPLAQHVELCGQRRLLLVQGEERLLVPPAQRDQLALGRVHHLLQLLEELLARRHVRHQRAKLAGELARAAQVSVQLRRLFGARRIELLALVEGLCRRRRALE